jgi:dihydrofolate reductase
MFLFYAIAAMSENRVIGSQGKIPWHIPDDFRWFKNRTLGRTIVMGRKTFESIGRLLPGRKTIVLTKSGKPHPDVETCLESDQLIQRWHTNSSFDHSVDCMFICGGAEIYGMFLPFCSVLYLTRVKKVVDGDTYFPPFESNYKLNQVIHETSEFRVERWFSNQQSWRLSFEPPPDEWPFPN